MNSGQASDMRCSPCRHHSTPGFVVLSGKTGLTTEAQCLCGEARGFTRRREDAEKKEEPSQPHIAERTTATDLLRAFGALSLVDRISSRAGGAQQIQTSRLPPNQVRSTRPLPV